MKYFHGFTVFTLVVRQYANISHKCFLPHLTGTHSCSSSISVLNNIYSLARRIAVNIKSLFPMKIFSCSFINIHGVVFLLSEGSSLL